MATFWPFLSHLLTVKASGPTVFPCLPKDLEVSSLSLKSDLWNLNIIYFGSSDRVWVPFFVCLFVLHSKVTIFHCCEALTGGGPE